MEVISHYTWQSCLKIIYILSPQTLSSTHLLASLCHSHTGLCPVRTLYGMSALKTLLGTENWGEAWRMGATALRAQDSGSTTPHLPRWEAPGLCGRQHLWRRALQGLPALRVEARARPANQTALPGSGGQN